MCPKALFTPISLQKYIQKQLSTTSKMINIYPVAHNSRKNKEGLTQIRIAIYANGQTRYIPSGIYLLDQSQLVDGNIVNHPDAKRLNDTLRRLINKTRFNIDILDYTYGLTAAEIVRLISPGEAQKPLTLGVILENPGSDDPLGQGRFAP